MDGGGKLEAAEGLMGMFDKLYATCPNAANHTPCPKGYAAWDEWAKQMSQTHEQVRCSGCKLFAIWIEKVHPAETGDTLPTS